jgi:hypothetical protein
MSVRDVRKRSALRFKNPKDLHSSCVHLYMQCCAVLCYKTSCGEMESDSNKECIREQTAELCSVWRLASCTHSATSLSRDVPVSCSADVQVSLNCIVLVQFTCIVDVCCITCFIIFVYWPPCGEVRYVILLLV